MQRSIRQPLLGLALLCSLLGGGCHRPEGDGLDPRIEQFSQVYRQEGAEKALPLFTELAVELSRTGQDRDQAAALRYLGECHWRLGNTADARLNLDRALTLAQSSGDRLGKGKTLNVIGLLEWDQGNYPQALARFEEAGALGRALGDAKLEGASLNNRSLVHDELGEYDTSLKQYQQVLQIYEKADFPRGVGDTLGNIGGVHLLLGQFRSALGYYQRALEISTQLESRASMSQDHGNIGLCLLGLGEVDGALGHLQRAIALSREAGMRQDEAYWLREQGNGFIQKGLYDQGLQNHRAALVIYEQLGAQAELAEALHDSGRLHVLLGDRETATRQLNRALSVARAIGLARAVTVNLLSLGDLKLHAGELDDATTLFKEARQRAAEAAQKHLLAESLLRLASVHLRQRDLNLAQAEATQSINLAKEIEAKNIQAEALLSRAEILRTRQRLDDALRDLDAATALIGEGGDPDLLWRFDLSRARTAEAKGDVPGAIAALRAAAARIENVRSQIRETRFRAGYLDDKFEVYRELMRLQLEQGKTADAFATAERLRARTYAEQLGGRSATPMSAEDRLVEARLRERVRHLRATIDDEDDNGEPAHPQRAMTRFASELRLAEQEYQVFQDDHSQPGKTLPVETEAAAVQATLNADDALLEYVIGPNRLTVFVLTRQRIAAHTTALDETELNSRISLLRDLGGRPGDERWVKPARRLSDILISPLVSARELDGIRHLYLVPHGSLSYLSFALLPIAGKPQGELLIERFTLSYLPAAVALLAKPRDGQAAKAMLALAPSRTKLRFASEEARLVEKLYQPHSRLLVGATATETQLKQLAQQYRIVHLATHGYFDKVNPLLSGLELESDEANDGLLQVHEVLGLRLQTDLVTLSACDTALGSGYFAETPTGDEFVGMTRAFLAAGSDSVLATLWPIDDRASVSLMQQFYAGISTSRSAEKAAEALAIAQREMRQSSELRHPYYWAAYVLVGGVDRRPHKEITSEGRA